jgi:hypothetical protein
MKSLNPLGKRILFVHLAFLFGCGLLGAALGEPKHTMLGLSLGSFIGTLIPGLYAIAASRNKQAKQSEFVAMCAAVFDNGWIKNEAVRPHVETIRGLTYSIWFAATVMVLVAGYVCHMAFGGLCLMFGAGIMVGWLFNLAWEI